MDLHTAAMIWERLNKKTGAISLSTMKQLEAALRMGFAPEDAARQVAGDRK